MTVPRFRRQSTVQSARRSSLRARAGSTRKGCTCAATAACASLPGASLKLLAHDTQNYEVIRIWDVRHVVLENPRVDGSKELNAATGGEWGMGISIAGSTDVTILSPTHDQLLGRRHLYREQLRQGPAVFERRPGDESLCLRLPSARRVDHQRQEYPVRSSRVGKHRRYAAFRRTRHRAERETRTSSKTSGSSIRLRVTASSAFSCIWKHCREAARSTSAS